MPKILSSDGELPVRDVAPVDLTLAPHVMHGRLPAIDVVQDRLSRQLRAELFQYMHYGVQVEEASTHFESHDEVVRHFAQPSLLGIVSMSPLRGFSILAADGPLTSAVADRLCGAEVPADGAPNGDFSPFEARVAKRLLEVLGSSVVYAWKGIADVDLQIIRTERNASFVAIADAREQLIVMRVKLALVTGSGEVTVAIPYTAVEPIRDRLSTAMALTAVHGDDLKRWRMHLAQAVDAAPAPLRAELLHLDLSARAVAALHVGETLPIPEPRRARVYCGGVHLFDGEFGEKDGSLAVRVKQFAHVSDSNTE